MMCDWSGSNAMPSAKSVHPSITNFKFWVKNAEIPFQEPSAKSVHPSITNFKFWVRNVEISFQESCLFPYASVIDNQYLCKEQTLC